ncbi:YggT family protein [Nitriliruptor alkaliphilus]|uniref:YggT family protein n=1 Tax=Nitriliruptor alkaliphilus TaxID=427918 RepID=UPI0006965257|nr:YggT family protein [Nitriliruptor alkaliphilus]
MIEGQNLLEAILTTLVTGLSIYLLVMLAYVIFSWVPRPPEPLVPIRLGSAALVDPLMRPLRGIIPPLKLGGIALDLSIIVLFIAVRLLIWILGGLADAVR